ncbi:DUF4476 domain-containing protein [Candidatus Amoebophilus asiaticus]|nr:DUF4476 domain-containing protein [Candidatus Amoebophilus asiaticus]
MKTRLIAIVVLFVLTHLSTFSQQSNLIVFAEEGEKFWLILNGIKQNENPETNVKVSGINTAGYKLKIIFQEVTNGEVNKTLYLEPNTEYTFNVRRRKETFAGNQLRAISDDLDKEFEFKKSKPKKKRELFVLRLLSQVSLAAATPSSATKNSSQVVVHHHPDHKATSQTVIVSGQTTTTTTTQQQGVNQGASVGIRASDQDVNITMNIAGEGSNVQSGVTQTTTTTSTTLISSETSSTHTEQHADSYYLPGYNGPIGCPVPMSDNEFSGVKNSIQSKTFEDSKIKMAKQVINSNCLLSSQVKKIMRIFDFEDTKLELAKYAYGYTYDLGNYYKVNDAFEFESSIDELNEFINSR